nr:MoxR family ATPase [Prescottella equi]
LVRLQCYEGLGADEALYDWNYQRQLLAVRVSEARGDRLQEADLFTEPFPARTPDLRCVRHRGPIPPVLLIDEIDRADDEFEALLLEFLGEAAVTVPEIGTFVADRPPIVVLTSNRSRDLHDALRRRCLYHWIDYPAPSGPRRSCCVARFPARPHPLIASVTDFLGAVRRLDLDKAPGVAEAVDWVSALAALGAADLVAADALASLGAIAKTPDDRTVLAEAVTAYAASGRTG